MALPIRDRRRSFTFFTEGLDLEAVGEPASDGLPEPLQFVLNDGVGIVLVPTGGFGWIIGDREVASPGLSECVLRLDRETDGEVDELIARVRLAGADVVAEPEQKPWGYQAAFTDPDGHVWMVASQPRGASS